MEKIDRYEIKGELSRGGMATVYYAYDPRVGREVAIKVMLKEFLNDPTFRQRFEREVKSVVDLEHPAIVPVYDYGEDNGQPFLVMRYMSGGTLAERLEQGPLSVEDASVIIARVGAALDQAHARGIIHRDLKPGNILFDQYNNAFLSDFGIVKIAALPSTITDKGGLVGTPAYMSPEQVQGDLEVDNRGDIYSFGVILYEMLSGAIPFNSDSPMDIAVKHVTDPVPHILSANPDLPREIEDVIAKALAKDRDDRYKTVGEMVDAVLKVTSGDVKQLMQAGKLKTRGADPLKPSAPDQKDEDNTIGGIAKTPDTSPAPVSPFSKIPLWVLGAGGVVALIIIGGLALTVFRGSRDSSSGPNKPSAGEVSAGPTPVGGGTGDLIYASDQNGNMGIYGIGVLGGDTTRIIQDDNNNRGPVYSPDGSKIVYRTQRGGMRTIVLVNADGSNPVALTDNTLENFSPSWSPDGSKIAFVSTRDGNAEIYVMNADGSNQTRLTESIGNDVDPSWSPDGAKILFDSGRERNAEIYIMNADGSSPLRLTDSPFGDYQPVMSPDGAKIVFVSERDGNPELYIMDSDGTDPVRLTENTAADLTPSWSPDGTRIAFVSRRDGNAEIYIMTPDGKEQTRVTNMPGEDLDPSWKPRSK
jgi:eukaryotic-like serine/threonine-protein kinase